MGLKIQWKKINGSRTAWIKFLKPALNIASPYIGMEVSAKIKNPKLGQATANILKGISVGKMLSLIDMHGSGLRLKVLRNHFKGRLQINWVVVLKIYVTVI